MTPTPPTWDPHTPHTARVAPQHRLYLRKQPVCGGVGGGVDPQARRRSPGRTPGP